MISSLTTKTSCCWPINLFLHIIAATANEITMNDPITTIIIIFKTPTEPTMLHEPPEWPGIHSVHVGPIKFLSHTHSLVLVSQRPFTQGGLQSWMHKGYRVYPGAHMLQEGPA